MDALSPGRQLTSLQVEAGCVLLLSDGWQGNDGRYFLTSLVKQVVVVVIATVFERHDVGEQVAVGEMISIGAGSLVTGPIHFHILRPLAVSPT